MAFPTPQELTIPPALTIRRAHFINDRKLIMDPFVLTKDDLAVENVIYRIMKKKYPYAFFAGVEELITPFQVHPYRVDRPAPADKRLFISINEIRRQKFKKKYPDEDDFLMGMYAEFYDFSLDQIINVLRNTKHFSHLKDTEKVKSCMDNLINAFVTVDICALVPQKHGIEAHTIESHIYAASCLITSDKTRKYYHYEAPCLPVISFIREFSKLFYTASASEAERTAAVEGLPS